MNHGRHVDFIDLINSAINDFINFDKNIACRILLDKARFERRGLLRPLHCWRRQLRNGVCVTNVATELASVIEVCCQWQDAYNVSQKWATFSAL